MNLGQLGKLGCIERRGDMIIEGPLLDLMMDTDMLKDRVVNGELADIFTRAPQETEPHEAEILSYPQSVQEYDQHVSYQVIVFGSLVLLSTLQEYSSVRQDHHHCRPYRFREDHPAGRTARF